MAARLGVQRLDQDGRAFRLGDRRALLEAPDRVLDRGPVLHAAAVAEKADDVGDPLARGPGDVLFERPNDRRVVAGLVQAVLDGARGDIATRDGQPVIVRDGPFVHLQEVDGGEADFGDTGTEFA